MLKSINRLALLASVTLGLVFATVVGATNLNTSSSWHGLSQTQRNNRILSTGLQQVGNFTGVQCKEWVQNVVHQASNGAVYPPQNKNDYQWHSHQRVHNLPHPYPPSFFKPGQIIQMRWKNAGNGMTYPHTAIVKSVGNNTMEWVDCNWQGDTVVRVRTVNINDFHSRVGSFYTVYEIR